VDKKLLKRGLPALRYAQVVGALICKRLSGPYGWNFLALVSVLTTFEHSVHEVHPLRHNEIAIVPCLFEATESDWHASQVKKGEAFSDTGGVDAAVIDGLHVKSDKGSDKVSING
jgi:hypothetical protein